MNPEIKTKQINDVRNLKMDYQNRQYYRKHDRYEFIKSARMNMVFGTYNENYPYGYWDDYLKRERN